MSAAPLPERFARLWRRMGARDDGHAICGELLEAYQEPHRHYHGLDHLRDCLSQLDAAPRGAENRGATETALWFHDAVYDTRVHDNEARSAALAADALRDSGVQDDLAREVARLVRLTDHVRPAPDRLSALLCDIDLSILGGPPRSSRSMSGGFERSTRGSPNHTTGPPGPRSSRGCWSASRST